ncbi:CENP-B N-terminal DNA-binding domain [Popillia japonica]|uniref:CENP-B N-terminal DNA-binding domain n=1 Tax=Popillia japonica TaxID=7064 RepID=A0AAW1L536_POPJA
MIRAMDAVKNEGVSKKCAAKKFGVPRTTLKRRLEIKNEGMSKKCAAKKFGVPRTTLKRRLEKICLKEKWVLKLLNFLSGGEEQLLANWILSMGRKGFPVHATNLLFTVHKIMKETGRQTVFKDGMPGKTWFAAFLRRHPEINEEQSLLQNQGFAAFLRRHPEINEEQSLLQNQGLPSLKLI